MEKLINAAETVFAVIVFCVCFCIAGWVGLMFVYWEFFIPEVSWTLLRGVCLYLFVLTSVILKDI